MIEFIAGAAVYALVDSLTKSVEKDRPSAPPGFISYRGRYIRIQERTSWPATEFTPIPEEPQRTPAELLADVERQRAESVILKGCG